MSNVKPFPHLNLKKKQKDDILNETTRIDEYPQLRKATYIHASDRAVLFVHMLSVLSKHCESNGKYQFIFRQSTIICH